MKASKAKKKGPVRGANAPSRPGKQAGGGGGKPTKRPTPGRRPAPSGKIPPGMQGRGGWMQGTGLGDKMRWTGPPPQPGDPGYEMYMQMIDQGIDPGTGMPAAAPPDDGSGNGGGYGDGGPVIPAPPQTAALGRPMGTNPLGGVMGAQQPQGPSAFQPGSGYPGGGGYNSAPMQMGGIMRPTIPQAPNAPGQIQQGGQPPTVNQPGGGLVTPRPQQYGVTIPQPPSRPMGYN